jgi:hypothetical protein
MVGHSDNLFSHCSMSAPVLFDRLISFLSGIAKCYKFANSFSYWQLVTKLIFLSENGQCPTYCLLVNHCHIFLEHHASCYICPTVQIQTVPKLQNKQITIFTQSQILWMVWGIQNKASWKGWTNKLWRVFVAIKFVWNNFQLIQYLIHWSLNTELFLWAAVLSMQQLYNQRLIFIKSSPLLPAMTLSFE